MDLELSISRIKSDIATLHQYTSTPGKGTTRLPFTKEARDAAEHIKIMMKNAGLEVKEDEAGNVIGLLKGENPNEEAIVVGSHFDTVQNGGDFDGLAGVISGIELARLFRCNNIKLKRDFIVVAFCDEEGMRFGTGYFGSKSILGQITQEDLHNFKDKDNISVYEAMRNYGMAPEELPNAKWDLSKIKAFIEIHIEQGPVLYQKRLDIGLVKCIVGIQRYIITVNGRADHAGTTPMDMRVDAVETASKVISKIPDWARAQGSETVATTGFMKVLPGGMNIVAEEVQFSVDIRSSDAENIKVIVGKIKAELDTLCGKNGSTYSMDNKLSIEPVELHGDMIGMLKKNCDKYQYNWICLNSGAGHDSLAIAPHIDTVMVFVPSKDGRSHCPVEWCEYSDIAKAVAIVYDLIIELQ